MFDIFFRFRSLKNNIKLFSLLTLVSINTSYGADANLPIAGFEVYDNGSDCADFNLDFINPIEWLHQTFLDLTSQLEDGLREDIARLEEEILNINIANPNESLTAIEILLEELLFLAADKGWIEGHIIINQFHAYAILAFNALEPSGEETRETSRKRKLDDNESSSSNHSDSNITLNRAKKARQSSGFLELLAQVDSSTNAKILNGIWKKLKASDLGALRLTCNDVRDFIDRNVFVPVSPYNMPLNLLPFNCLDLKTYVDAVPELRPEQHVCGSLFIRALSIQGLDDDSELRRRIEEFSDRHPTLCIVAKVSDDRKTLDGITPVHSSGLCFVPDGHFLESEALSPDSPLTQVYDGVKGLKHKRKDQVLSFFKRFFDDCLMPLSDDEVELNRLDTVKRLMTENDCLKFDYIHRPFLNKLNILSTFLDEMNEWPECEGDNLLRQIPIRLLAEYCPASLRGLSVTIRKTNAPLAIRNRALENISERIDDDIPRGTLFSHWDVEKGYLRFIIIEELNKWPGSDEQIEKIRSLDLEFRKHDDFNNDIIHFYNELRNWPLEEREDLRSLLPEDMPSGLDMYSGEKVNYSVNELRCILEELRKWPADERLLRTPHRYKRLKRLFEERRGFY